MPPVDQTPPKEQQPPLHEAAEGLPQRAVLWGSVALLALLVLLTSLMSQQPNRAWGLAGVRLMPRLPEPMVYLLVGLFALAAIAVLAVLFPRNVRFRRKKQPDEFQEYHEPPKVSFGVFVVLLLPLLIAIGLIAYLYWGGRGPTFARARPAPSSAFRPDQVASTRAGRGKTSRSRPRLRLDAGYSGRAGGARHPGGWSVVPVRRASGTLVVWHRLH